MQAHSSKQVSSPHNYNCSFTTNYAGIPPHPLHFQWGSQDMYGHFIVWMLDSPRNGSGSPAQPFLQSRGAQQGDFLWKRSQMSALEKCLLPSYLDQMTALQILVSTHRLPMQHYYWVFLVLELNFMTPES